MLTPTRQPTLSELSLAGARPPTPTTAASSNLSGVRKLPRSRPNRLLELAGKVARASWGGIAFLSPRGELVEHLTFGMADTATANLTRSVWLRALAGAAAGQTIPTRLVGAELALVPEGLPPPGAVLIVPLARPGWFRGALYLVRPDGEAPFTAADEELVLPIASCLEDSSLFEEAHLLAQLRLLNQVAQAAAGNLNLEPLLGVALRELDRHLPMSVCAVWLAEEKKRGQAADSAHDSQVEDPVVVLAGVSSGQSATANGLGLCPGRALPLSQTPFGPCWLEGGAVYFEWGPPIGGHVGNVPLPGTLPTCPQAHRPGAMPSFATPLRAGDRTVGILQSVSNRPAGFTSEQVQMLYLVADLLGPAISNCQLYGRLRKTYEELRTTQQELIRSEKLRALGELASGMAHDFNNSLCGVLGFLEVTLRDATLSEVNRGHLELARTSALDAAQTVRRVQDFARVRRNDLTMQAVDANELVRDTVALTRHRWDILSRGQGAPITLEVRTDAAAPLLGNPSELREVLTNLIFNAVDAMPRGGTMMVRSWSTPEGVFLAVRDTGVGMGPAVRQRLFEPFFSTKGERGNGMGLSVAFGIIKQHGGGITVESEVGEGSTFTLRLPPLTLPTLPGGEGRVRGVTRPAALQPAPAPVVPPDPLPGGDHPCSLRVLVVEDEEPICRLLEMVLTHMGHRPRVLRSGAEAVALIRAEPFDVVLTDLGLPDVSGEEVARTVAQHAPATPVVLLTGWAEQLKADSKELPGVTRVLGKPVTIKCLAETLEAVVPR